MSCSQRKEQKTTAAAANHSTAAAAADADANFPVEHDPSSSSSPNANNDDSNSPAQPSTLSCPFLPPTIFGAAMDYLRYGEVRTALLVGKTIAHHAVKHVQTLNICNPYELNVKASRRFGNVREVNILCLIAFEHAFMYEHSLVRDAATRSVPFLLSFPKLDTTFLGGIQILFADSDQLDRLEYDSKCQYSPTRCVAPDDHADIFRGLMMSLCGAFGSMALPQSLDLGGIHDGCRACSETNREPGCNFCRDCCRSLPFHNVVDMNYLKIISPLSSQRAQDCISARDVLEIVSSRPGGREFLEGEISVLRAYLATFGFEQVAESESPSTKEREMFVHRMKELNATIPHRVYYAPLESLQFYLEHGFKPSNMARRTLSLILQQRGRRSLYASNSSDYDASSREILAKASFDRLIAAGFGVEKDDFIVVDAAKEPALVGFEKLLR